MDGRVYTHRHTHIRGQTGMSMKALAQQGPQNANTGEGFGSAVRHGETRSLYTLWHCVQYVCLLYKLSGRADGWAYEVCTDIRTFARQTGMSMK